MPCTFEILVLTAQNIRMCSPGILLLPYTHNTIVDKFHPVNIIEIAANVDMKITSLLRNRYHYLNVLPQCYKNTLENNVVFNN